MRIPKDVETKVVTRLYGDAKTLDWATLTPQQHSAQYTKWVDDPEVGGRLREYLSASDARVWIKDGPMKEWSRSLSGVGKYANLVDGADDTPARLARKALGDGWEVDSDTLRVKPLRVTARNEEDETILTWAPATGLKHLVWAALTASAQGDSREWVLCVVETFTKPTPANEKQAHQRLAKRCGLRLVHVSL
ncbi:MAG: hypothetical protein DLM61_15675 [Pseudonocardiales bacterium]|nr:hypothetical protein [Actinomycetota bacterium]PZS27967.1 MAG: hypothetical protein DLM61_15675 [Pseudonocardiales bacterium]